MGKRLKWVGERLAFTKPTPLDAWLLSSLSFWGLALICSATVHGEFHSVDLRTALAPIFLSILALLFAVGCAMSQRSSGWNPLPHCKPAKLYRSVVRGIRSRSMKQWLVSLVVGLVAYFFVARWMDYPLSDVMKEELGFGRSESDLQSGLDSWTEFAFWVATAWVSAFVAGWTLIRIGLGLIKAGRHSLAHRLRTMLVFLAIGFPAVILRNIFDPEHLVSQRILNRLFLLGAAVLNVVLLWWVVKAWSSYRSCSIYRFPVP